MKVAKLPTLILEPNNFIYLGLKKTEPLPKCLNWGLTKRVTYFVLIFDVIFLSQYGRLSFLIFLLQR